MLAGRTAGLQVAVVAVVVVVAAGSLVSVANAGGIGVDVSVPVSEDQAACLLESGYSFLIARAFRSVGSVDENAPDTIKNWWAAGGENAAVYIFPDTASNMTGAEQVQAMYDYLIDNDVPVFTGAEGEDPAQMVTAFWLDIEGAGEYWPEDVDFNLDFIDSMASQADALGVEYGIYSGRSSWQDITGDTTIYSDKSSKLWFPHYDGHPSIDDYLGGISPTTGEPYGDFGGWSAPAIKQFLGSATVCNGTSTALEADLNYML